MTARILPVAPAVVSNPTKDAETATLQHIDELVREQRSLRSGKSIERAALGASAANELARLQLLIDVKWEELRRQRSLRQRSSDVRTLLGARRRSASRSSTKPQQPPLLVSAQASPEPSANPSPDGATVDGTTDVRTGRRRGSWWITMALRLALNGALVTTGSLRRSGLARLAS